MTADYDELDQLLNDTYERPSDAAADLARQAEEKEKAACDEKQQAEDIRTQAMERQEKKKPNKRKSTVLKELLEEGRKSKNDIEMKRIALEEQRLQVDKERHTFFENVVTKQQQGLTAESTNTSTGAATADDENALRKPTTTAGVPTTATKGNG